MQTLTNAHATHSEYQRNTNRLHTGPVQSRVNIVFIYMVHALIHQPPTRNNPPYGRGNVRTRLKHNLASTRIYIQKKLRGPSRRNLLDYQQGTDGGKLLCCVVCHVALFQVRRDAHSVRSATTRGMQMLAPNIIFHVAPQQPRLVVQYAETPRAPCSCMCCVVYCGVLTNWLRVG